MNRLILINLLFNVNISRNHHCHLRIAQDTTTDAEITAEEKCEVGGGAGCGGVIVIHKQSNPDNRTAQISHRRSDAVATSDANDDFTKEGLSLNREGEKQGAHEEQQRFL